jgi:transposase
MKSKAYRAADVNKINLSELRLEERSANTVHVGLDIGKASILCVLRWGVNDFDRPWRVRNSHDLPRLVELLLEVKRSRCVVVAMEPTGTYGDPARQALEQAGLLVHRVSPKNASDYAEVFDGVPSQHDGKDAAVIAELSAQGKSWRWPMAKLTETEQELGYQVDWIDAQRRQMVVWSGRLEAMLSRHWPEATEIVGLTSGSLLNCLAAYGGPRGLAADTESPKRNWARYLSSTKVESLLLSARQTRGVETGRWDEERLRRYAQQIQSCRKEIREGVRRLRELAREHEKIRAMGKVVGVPTACVLWADLGNPERYSSGPAYRKGMGLNLAEHSSGKWEGTLRISKRGSSRVRRWLYMAALRWVNKEPVRSWYLKQKAARRGEGKPAVIAVMRKLALAVYAVGGRNEPFDQKKLYESVTAIPSA